MVQPQNSYSRPIPHGVPVRATIPPQNAIGPHAVFAKSNQAFHIPFHAQQFDALGEKFKPPLQNHGQSFYYTEK